MHGMDNFTNIAPLILVAWIVIENQAAGRSEVDSPRRVVDIRLTMASRTERDTFSFLYI